MKPLLSPHPPLPAHGRQPADARPLPRPLRSVGWDRAWSLRLFALAVGSWLYRMDYGFWLLLFDGWGHSEDFRGPSDVLMAFWFYLPNLLVAELFIRARRGAALPALRLAAAGLLLAATGFLLLGTYFFTLFLLCSVVALAHSSALHGSPFPLSSPMCPFTQCEANHVSPPESTYGE